MTRDGAVPDRDYPLSRVLQLFLKIICGSPPC
jgi:hypothetical protein